MSEHARSCQFGSCVGCRVDRIERFLISLATVNSSRQLTSEEFDHARDEIVNIAFEISTEHEKKGREG